jgi:hypothetical protein
MVAVIKTGHSIHRIVNYNENKIKQGVAECIGAANFPVDPDNLSINLKLRCFLKQMDLNQNVKRNSVHISLNFDVSEKHLSKEKLMAIADGYMAKLGFGKQPYLTYQHRDAGHPHIHIVTTNIEADGKRIDLHHLGIRMSEPARKYIENTFGLVRAEEQKKQEYKLEAVSAQRIQYGKSETKRAIQIVLDHVISQYIYTSLPELNAVLKQYNVLAERGSEKSRVYQHKGLLYKVLDSDGKSVGIPIKASTFYNKPTLKVLENKFKENEAKRIPYKARIKNAIDLALLGKKGITIHALAKALAQDGVTAVLRQSKDGMLYGITYVDHRTKCIFNGSALGKQYSAKAIAERCQQGGWSEQKKVIQGLRDQQNPVQKDISIGKPKLGEHPDVIKQGDAVGAVVNALDKLMQPDIVSEFVPYQLKRNKKKKRRKHFTNHQ